MCLKTWGGVTTEKNNPLTLEIKEELPGYWKKAELKTPGARAGLVIDYYNRRIKVMDFTGPFEEIAGAAEALAGAEEVGKIIVYTPPEKLQEPKTFGYAEEGVIRGYYSGKDCHIFSSYTEHSRGISVHKEQEDRVIKNCLRKVRETGKNRKKQESSRKKRSWKKQKDKNRLQEEYALRPAVQADAPEMASFYMQGFHLYPTPLHRESYLLETMESSVLYMVLEKKGKIVSLASAEMDPETGSAEITDCLTAPSERGKGLIRILISALEKELAERDFKNVYTLCRAPFAGINAAFASLGYTYTGRLVNNCRIGEGFEDMNIWCKELQFH